MPRMPLATLAVVAGLSLAAAGAPMAAAQAPAAAERLAPYAATPQEVVDRMLQMAAVTSTDVVYQFCRQSPYAAVLTPSHGRFVGAASKPFSEYRKSPGETLGLNWFIPNVNGKRSIRHVLFDANYWKTFVQARLKVALGDRGCLSLFGEHPDPHRLLAEHQIFFDAVWQKLTLAQRAVLRAVVLEHGEGILGADVRTRYRLGGASSVQTALAALQRLDVIARDDAGRYTAVDSLMREWVARRTH